MADSPFVIKSKEFTLRIIEGHREHPDGLLPPNEGNVIIYERGG